MLEGGGSALPLGLEVVGVIDLAWVVGGCWYSCLLWGCNRVACAVVMTRNQSLFLRGRVFAGSK
ncbi:MAG: hypothetical protein HG466_005160 [Prevotella sp.]|uniref:hypothetical protein n=1 Tax=Prevotella nigrescens TaxID=28133 RepID=UPI0017DCC348|nr:hypothetical protein [Prevotella nigrescens]MBB1530076.1 hypothetical protein [Prevotella sp.]